MVRKKKPKHKQYKLVLGERTSKSNSSLCPQCGAVIYITRSKLGSGDKRGKGLKLSQNRNMILETIKELGGPCSVFDVLSALKGKKRNSYKGNNWDYHNVQVDMSLLLGGEYIKVLEHDEILRIWREKGYNNNKKTPLYIYNGTK
jgi:hypothetical protein